MMPPEGVKQQLKGVVDCAPTDKGSEVPDGELTHE